MESLSEPLETIAISLAISAPAYMRDHHVGGLAILPAVEALQTVARSKPTIWGADPRRQARAVFHHLLEIHPGAGEITALHEHVRYADGRCLSRLTTLRSGRHLKFTRRMEHVSVLFMPPRLEEAGCGTDPLADLDDAGMPEGPTFTVPNGRLYDELVPFGPAYRNVRGDIILAETGVSTTVFGGDFPEAAGPLGSPFPLDAAMHAACAWGQRYRNRVVFPIGFDRREIFSPTRAGETYPCRITPLPGEGAILRFDIRLYGRDWRPVEVIRGLKMRDIFGGKLTPPAWVREGV
ncbi:MAG: polyketide synthase dehydratase domain-containing protein [Deltaproteobacteria bacterium]|nr:polyketide synthase dehydratase domain-containing protein [Deltaproteobacteria bacterium]